MYVSKYVCTYIYTHIYTYVYVADTQGAVRRQTTDTQGTVSTVRDVSTVTDTQGTVRWAKRDSWRRNWEQRQ